MNTLKEILKEHNLNISNNPIGTDKGDYKSYVDYFYDYYFLRFRDKKINLLEIGFRHGASLFLWSNYFRNGTIIGLDNGSDPMVVNSSINDEWVNRDNIEIRLCDAYSKEVSNSINESFDIIIDDGPHTFKSQKLAINRYFNKLKFNGLFVIEDILNGYITCLGLAISTPLNGRIKIFNLRKYKPQRDNMLFVIYKNGFCKTSIFSRMIVIINCILNIPGEILYKFICI